MYGNPENIWRASGLASRFYDLITGNPCAKEYFEMYGNLETSGGRAASRAGSPIWIEETPRMPRPASLQLKFRRSSHLRRTLY